MDLTFEPSSLSTASRIALGALLTANLLLLFYLIFADSTDREERRTVSAFPAERRLVLIEELPAEELAARMVAEGAPARLLPENQSEAPPQNLSCRGWGPFASEETLNPVRTALSQVDPAVRVVVTEVEAPPDFLVYLDSDNNLDNARRILQELESQGIEAYVIAGGEFVNSVSAGVFSNRSGAEDVSQRLTDLGYAAAVQSLERSQEVSYLLGHVPAEFALDELDSQPCAEIAPLLEIL